MRPALGVLVFTALVTVGYLVMWLFTWECAWDESSSESFCDTVVGFRSPLWRLAALAPAVSFAALALTTWGRRHLLAATAAATGLGVLEYIILVALIANDPAL